MPEQAKIMTLHDHDTGKPIAPRTVVEALSGEGKKWNYVGFAEDNVVGVVEGTWPCNRNLLDNWYFVGGGSQQDGGQFPINQRAKTKYSDTGYTIDRWINTVDSSSVSVNSQDGVLEITNPGNISFGILQVVDMKILEPMTVTLSVLYKGSVSIGYWSSGYNRTNKTSNEWDIAAFTYEIPTSYEPVYRVYCPHISAQEGMSVQIAAAKLELGSQQTLAHKEGDTWVLNEIPDYGTELAKCQRYQQVLSKWEGYPQPIGTFITLNAEGLTRFHIPLPVPLRCPPAIILIGSLRLEAVFPDENFITLSLDNTDGMSAELGVNSISLLKQIPGLKAGMVGRFDGSLNAGYIILDSNI